MPAIKQQTLVNAAIEMLHTRLVELESKVQTLRVETEKNLEDLHETARSHADLIDRMTSGDRPMMTAGDPPSVPQ